MFGLPNVACAFLSGWPPPPVARNAPPAFRTPGPEVPCAPKVEPVGATSLGNLEWYIGSLGGTYAGGGISA